MSRYNICIHVHLRSQSQQSFCLILCALHAKEEVRTTRLMLSVFLATLESTFLVPPTAGSMSCFFGSGTSLMKGEAV